MKQRLLSLDLVKVLAMVGVMCLHTEMNFYENPIAQFLYMSAVVSIPLFFMVSGYLLYGKKSLGYGYSGKKLFGIFRFVMIITIAFWLMSGVRHGEPFLIYTLGSLVQKGSFGIFWYFGAMMIIYLLLPILHRLFTYHRYSFILLTIVLGIACNVIFALNFLGTHIENNTIQTFRLWNWIFYFNLGGLARKKYIPKFTKCLLGVALLFVINFIFQYEVTPYMPTIFCEYFYSSIPVMILSYFLFSSLLMIDDNKLTYINGGAKLFLPCYTLHFFVIGKTLPLFQHYVYAYTSYTAPLYWIIVASVTILISWLLMKIPYMDKVFRI